MNHELKELKAAETEALKSYGDGYEAGINEILEVIKKAMQEAKPNWRLAAVEQVLMDYGVDLDEQS